MDLKNKKKRKGKTNQQHFKLKKLCNIVKTLTYSNSEMWKSEVPPSIMTCVVVFLNSDKIPYKQKSTTSINPY